MACRNFMKKPEKIRILIADDHYIVRIGLIALVNTEPDMEVVAEAADGAQALELFGRLQPDLALLDMRMPVKNGIEATREIRSRFPSARVIMLTAFDGDEEIHKALEAGAQGYVFKNSSGKMLVPALRAVAAGQRWIPKEVASRLASRRSFEALTSREVQVLKELAKGLANKEIAAALNITEYTVKDHLKNILGKLRVADRTEAVTTAIQRGIIHL
jgi:DNA-binding NarL/FixJ family response regulator